MPLAKNFALHALPNHAPFATLHAMLAYLSVIYLKSKEAKRKHLLNFLQASALH
jgi:hypothetical protein